MNVSVGLDMVDVREVGESIARFGDRYLARLYTPGELADARGDDMARRLAARFAAKEATLKALAAGSHERGESGIDWRAIEVVRGPAGEPRLALHGWAAREAARRNVTSLAVSLTHEGDVAAAVVVATRRPLPSRLSWGVSKSRRSRG